MFSRASIQQLRPSLLTSKHLATLLVIHPRHQTTSNTPSRNYPPPPSPRKRPTRDLHGKVAIVTGAGSLGLEIGNGRATSILLAEDGASVVCVDKDLDLAKRTVSMIDDLRDESTKKIGPAVALAGDVTDPVSCDGIINQTISTFGRLDILINVVGILGPKGTAVEVDLEGWRRGLEVNVTSMMLMARYAIPAMRGGGRDEVKGSIVNIGSVAGLRGGTPSLLYPASKGAVVNMTRAMAAQHGGEGIRVNCVCPGMLFTPMMYADGKITDEMREARKRRSLLGTEGNAWDCASAIRFLACDEARWITGAVLTVDAGATATVSLSMG